VEADQAVRDRAVKIKKIKIKKKIKAVLHVANIRR
jgi:hypothetical protein